MEKEQKHRSRVKKQLTTAKEISNSTTPEPVSSPQAKKRTHFSFPKFNWPKLKLPFIGKKKTSVSIDTEVKENIPEVKKIEPTKPPLSKGRRFLNFLRSFFVIIIPLLLFAGAIPYGIYIGSAIIQPFFKAANFTITGNNGAFGTLKKKATLQKDGNNLTSILIVGIDTREKGSRLLNTDTIILASYNNASHKIAMVSFPRDLDVNYPNTPSIGKINATYYYGEQKRAGGGMDYLRTLIQNISGVPIQYYVMVDLKGFTTVIDQLGGVDVEVDTAFKGDYPTENYGWMKVTFAKGMQHMNGATALQYARIRHAYPGSEASDFARARRQQKIIQAVVDKATKMETLQNPKVIMEIIGTVANNIKFNKVTPEDIEAGLTILLEKGKPSMYSQVLDPAAGGRYGRLITRGSGHLYTLQPSAGRTNWSQVKAYLSDYAQDPTLVVGMGGSVCVYGAGKSDYKNTYKNMASRFYYAPIKDCGTIEKRDNNYVYNVGGENYASTAQFIAKVYGYTYVDATNPEVDAPRPSGSVITIAVAK